MRKLNLALTMLSLILMCSCTQYNGHIGPIFGSWSLVAITEDGLPIELDDETVFSFQNEVVRVARLVDPPYSTTFRYGNFSLSDDVLTLKFQAKPTPSDSYLYVTPDWLHFPLDGNPIHLEIRKLTGSEMSFTLDNDGKIYGYSFKKTW